MNNQLVKIESENWAGLRALYLPETSETILGLTTMANYIQWNERGPPIENLAIYSLNGDWSDGTFAVIDRYHLYCDSLNESNERLKSLLDLVDYSKGLRVMHVRSQRYPTLAEVLKHKQIELEFDDPNLLYYLPKEQAMLLNIELPEGFVSRKLSHSDVVVANNSWTYSHPGSLFYLQRLARLNSSCGIFTTEGNKLVSSGFQTQTGPVGTLYTDTAYRKRGLGSLVAKMIFKEIGESGYGVTACVKIVNTASRKIFEKIGCQVIDEVHWISMPCEWTEQTDFIKKQREH